MNSFRWFAAYKLMQSVDLKGFMVVSHIINMIHLVKNTLSHDFARYY